MLNVYGHHRDRNEKIQRQASFRQNDLVLLKETSVDPLGLSY